MATALPSSCEGQQSNNLDEYSDDSDAESEKVRKAKKPKKPGDEKWSGSLIPRLWRPSNSSQMSSCITGTKIVAIAALLGPSRLIHSHFRHEI